MIVDPCPEHGADDLMLVRREICIEYYPLVECHQDSITVGPSDNGEYEGVEYLEVICDCYDCDYRVDVSELLSNENVKFA